MLLIHTDNISRLAILHCINYLPVFVSLLCSVVDSLPGRSAVYCAAARCAALSTERRAAPSSSSEGPGVGCQLVPQIM